MINSPAFWTALALSAVGFWALPAAYRLGFLALASVAYLLSLEPISTCVLAGWSILFYLVASRPGPRPRLASWLIVGILGYLAWFKYVPPLLAALAPSPRDAQLVIPLGISYLTFKLIHYAIEASRGNLPVRSPQQFFCWILLFPTFTAGPIERFDPFLANQEGRWRAQSTVEGLTRIIHGLIKKVLIADLLLLPLNRGLTPALLLARLDTLGPHTLWRFMAVSFLYLYLDFSAYSDIAIGASRLFGFRIAENFNFPILAPNIGAFWRRWHMTLTGWCQAYVYLPTIGLTRSPYLATYATMTAIALWHAGSLNWVLWGVYHATGLRIWGTWSQLKRRRRWTFTNHVLWRLASVPLTLMFVVAGAVFPALAQAGRPYDSLRVLCKMFLICG